VLEILLRSQLQARDPWFSFSFSHVHLPLSSPTRSLVAAFPTYCNNNNIFCIIYLGGSARCITRSQQALSFLSIRVL
jgi:hypothetical protein